MTKVNVFSNLVYDLEKIEHDYCLNAERIFLSVPLYLYICSLKNFDIIYHDGPKFHGIPITIIYSEKNYYYYSISIKEFSISKNELMEENNAEDIL